MASITASGGFSSSFSGGGGSFGGSGSGGFSCCGGCGGLGGIGYLGGGGPPGPGLMWGGIIPLMCGLMCIPGRIGPGNLCTGPMFGRLIMPGGGLIGIHPGGSGINGGLHLNLFIGGWFGGGGGGGQFGL